MDLEIVGFDALLGSETTAYLSSSSSIPTSDSDQKQRLHGSGWNLPKHYSQDFSLRSTINGGNSTISENGQQMLSFSSPTSQMPPSAYGYGGLFNRVRGPFTQSQWMELENQALIYKYINANAAVPSNLLIPIIKASHYAHFPPFSVGWAPFHLRFSNSTDPEPGRCRRTDGKKWRCAKDAVPDQKYCERHMNRGRHRSRKPVENQTGHSVSTAAAASKLVIPAAVPADGLSLSQPGGAHRCPSSSNGNRVFLNRENNKLQDCFSQSTIYPSSNLKQTQFLDDPNQQTLCCSPTTYGSSYHNINEKDQYGLKGDDIQHERTQLSISIPVTSDFMSKEPSTKMGLGVGIMENETSSQKQASWIPVSWGSNANSIGGPLGEVLNKTNRHSSALDLMSVHQ